VGVVAGARVPHFSHQEAGIPPVHLSQSASADGERVVESLNVAHHCQLLIFYTSHLVWW